MFGASFFAATQVFSCLLSLSVYLLALSVYLLALSLSRRLRDVWRELLCCHPGSLVLALSVYFVSPIWHSSSLGLFGFARRDRALSRSKVDGFLPRSQHVNIRIVGDPSWAKLQGYLAHKKQRSPRTLQ